MPPKWVIVKKKMVVTYTMENPSTMTVSKLLIHATTPMNFKSIILNESLRNIIFIIIAFIWHSQQSKSTGMEIRCMFARCWDWEEGVEYKGV
jgi:uncharacterized membrane protein